MYIWNRPKRGGQPYGYGEITYVVVVMVVRFEELRSSWTHSGRIEKAYLNPMAQPREEKRWWLQPEGQTLDGNYRDCCEAEYLSWM